MNNLLIFFALPVATAILAIVLQKILRNPLLVAATFFAIYLIVTFAFFDASFLVFAILYTILAYVVAVLTKWICHLIELLSSQNNNDDDNENCTTTTNSLAMSNAMQDNNLSLDSNTLLPQGRMLRGYNGNCRYGRR